MNPPGIFSGTALREGLQDRTWFNIKPVLFIAALALSMLAWGWWVALLMSAIWFVGWLVYRAVCSHYYPSKANPIGYYLVRGTVASVTILLALATATWLAPPAGPQRDIAAWLGVLFFSIPPFSVIETNDVRWYMLFSGGCLATAGAYVGVGLTGTGLTALGAALAVLMIVLLVWHFYAGLIAKEQALDRSWRELSRFAEDHRVQDPTALRELVHLLNGIVGYGHQTTLRFNVPAQSAWRTFRDGDESFEWTAADAILEQVRRERTSAWAPAARSGSPDPLGLAYRLVLPIPGQPHRRLRAVVEVAVDLQRSHRVTVALLRALERVRLSGLFVQVFRHPADAARDELTRRLEGYVPALDQILDHWRTEEARRTFEDCAASILEYPETQSAQPVARTLAGYFQCDVAVWRLDPRGSLAMMEASWTAVTEPALAYAERHWPLRDLAVFGRWLGERPYGCATRRVAELGDPDRRALSALGYAEIVTCPVGHDGRALGLITLLGPRAFELTEREQDWLRRIAQLLGLGYVQHETATQLEQMVMHVHDVTELIQNLVAGGASAYAVRALHRGVAEKAQRILGADSVVLYGLDMHQRKIIHAVTAGALTVNDIASDFDEDSALQRCIDRRQPIFAPDARRDLYPRSRAGGARPPFVERCGIASTFATPLIVRDTIIGVMFANFAQPQVFGDHPQRLFGLFASLAAHTLALSGYHREWTMETIGRDRKRLRDNFHTHVKGSAEMIRSELQDCRDDLRREPPRLTLVASAIERSIGECDTILQTAGELLVAIDDRTDWTELEQKGLRAMLFTRAANLIADEGRRRITFVYNEARRLPLGYEKCILDFAVEAILNAVRHARGSVIDVQLQQSVGDVTLVVADRGPGLADLDARLAAGAFRTLKEAALDFVWRIAPRPGGGLEVMLKVPVRDSM